MIDGERSVGALAAAVGSPHLARSDRQSLLEADPGRMQRVDTRVSPARAVVEALGVRDLRAGSIAAAVSTSSGDGNLLRFQEVRDEKVTGGYSVIVRE